MNTLDKVDILYVMHRLEKIGLESTTFMGSYVYSVDPSANTTGQNVWEYDKGFQKQKDTKLFKSNKDKRILKPFLHT